jgi:predicted transcriptional regulator
VNLKSLIVIYLQIENNTGTNILTPLAMLTKEQRKMIQSELPVGSGIQIAKLLGMSQQSVCAFFKGRTSSYRVEKMVIEYYRAYKEDIDRRISSIFK